MKGFYLESPYGEDLLQTTHFVAPNHHLTPHPFNKNANNKIDNTHTKSK
jgi:hypothetical protein